MPVLFAYVSTESIDCILSSSFELVGFLVFSSWLILFSS